MQILKIIEVFSRDFDEQSKEIEQIKQEINNYWKLKKKDKLLASQTHPHYLLENENRGRLIITIRQASCNTAFETIYKTLKDNDAHELHYYFHKN